MKKKIIAVDFDGTLCENRYPCIGEPKQRVIDYVKKLSSRCILFLWTCRRDAHLDAAVRWCGEHGIKFDYINENPPRLVQSFGGDCRKICADLYIDDRAMNVKEIDNDNNTIFNEDI